MGLEYRTGLQIKRPPEDVSGGPNQNHPIMEPNQNVSIRSLSQLRIRRRRRSSRADRLGLFHQRLGCRLNLVQRRLIWTAQCSRTVLEVHDELIERSDAGHNAVQSRADGAQIRLLLSCPILNICCHGIYFLLDSMKNRFGFVIDQLMQCVSQASNRMNKRVVIHNQEEYQKNQQKQ